MSEETPRDVMQAFLGRDRFAGLVGIELIEAGGGRATARLKVRDDHRNGLDLVHGGALFALADLAFAAAVNSRGRVAVAIHCSISYLKAVRDGVLLAEVEEVSCGPKIAVYQIRVTDDAGELVARFDGTAYRKRESLAG